MTNYIALPLFILFLIFMAYHTYYEIFVADSFRYHEGTIISGKHKGRTGNIVSCWLFDLRVTLNCAANEEENEKWFQKLIDDDVGWVRRADADENTHWGAIVENIHDHHRVWFTVWRWQVQSHKQEESK